MKQTINSARIIAIGLFTLCTIGLTKNSFACGKTGNAVEVKYLGEIKNQLAIQLNLNNNEAGSYFINIKTMNHHILGSEIVQGAHLSEIFKLNPGDDDDLNATVSELRIEVTSEKTRKTQVYTISTLTGSAENEGTTKL